jgi:hypothetical protein
MLSRSEVDKQKSVIKDFQCQDWPVYLEFTIYVHGIHKIHTHGFAIDMGQFLLGLRNGDHDQQQRGCQLI